MKTKNRPPGNYCLLCDKKVVMSPKKNWFPISFLDDFDRVICSGYAHKICPISLSDDDDENQRVGQ